MNDHRHTGTLIWVSDIQEFDNNFKKREFIVETMDDNHKSTAIFECSNKYIDIVNPGMVGQEVTVSFNFKASYYKKGGRWFPKGQAWKIE